MMNLILIALVLLIVVEIVNLVHNTFIATRSSMTYERNIKIAEREVDRKDERIKVLDKRIEEQAEQIRRMANYYDKNTPQMRYIIDGTGIHPLHEDLYEIKAKEIGPEKNE